MRNKKNEHNIVKMQECMEFLNNIFTESFFITINPIRMLFFEFLTSVFSGIAAALSLTVILGILAAPMLEYLKNNMPHLVDDFLRLKAFLIMWVWRR